MLLWPLKLGDPSVRALQPSPPHSFVGAASPVHGCAAVSPAGPGPPDTGVSRLLLDMILEVRILKNPD